MRNESKFFKFTPKILPTGRESTVTLSPMYDRVGFAEGAQYQVAVIPTEGVPGQTSWGEIRGAR